MLLVSPLHIPSARENVLGGKAPPGVRLSAPFMLRSGDSCPVALTRRGPEVRPPCLTSVSASAPLQCGQGFSQQERGHCVGELPEGTGEWGRAGVPRAHQSDPQQGPGCRQGQEGKEKKVLFVPGLWIPRQLPCDSPSVTSD